VAGKSDQQGHLRVISDQIPGPEENSDKKYYPKEKSYQIFNHEIV